MIKPKFFEFSAPPPFCGQNKQIVRRPGNVSGKASGGFPSKVGTPCPWTGSHKETTRVCAWTAIYEFVI